MQFTLIHGPNIPCSYAILFSTASDFTFITRHIHYWELFSFWVSLFIFFFLELVSALLQSHIGHLPTWRGPSSSIISFSILIQFMGFSRQEYWTDLPFPFPVDYLLSKLSTMKVLRSSVTSTILGVTLFPVFLSSTLFSLCWSFGFPIGKISLCERI